MTVVAEAGSGEEACAICARQPADVVLMDLRLPGLSGVDAIRALRKSHPKLRFIVLTTYDGDEDIHRALEAGAQAYLLKAMSHTDLANAIRTVHAGRKFLPPSISKSLAGRPPHSELSTREMQVLELIVKGLSNREIGDTLSISEATVKWHVNMILSRLNVTDRTQATVAALQRGIVHLR
jgi:two-component system NarL family response regulator